LGAGLLLLSILKIKSVQKMSQTLLEKLQFADERNLLIQGLPSSIEKQFLKLAFAKNLTPLLKIKKIDFALVFAINERQLGSIVGEVLPFLQPDAKFWVAYPKPASKIATTLSRECSWICITGSGYEMVRDVPLDHCWTAIQFKRRSPPISSSIRLRAPLLEPVLVEVEAGDVPVAAKKPAARGRRIAAAR
jgi:hypothetical protein